MRILKLVGLAGLILAVTGTAGAVTLTKPYVGPIAFDVTNREMGDVYTPALDGVYGPGFNPLPGNVGVDYFPALGTIGQESGWGVLQIDTILSAEVAVSHKTIIEHNTDILWNGADGMELVGIFYGVQDLGFSQFTNPVTGAVSQAYESTAMKLEIWEQPAGTFDAVNGGNPGDGFRQGSAGRIGANAYLGIGFGPDGYPGVAGVDDDGINGVDDPGERGLGDDGASTLWASGETVPGFEGAIWVQTIDDGTGVNASAEFSSSYDPNVGVGNAAGRANFVWEITGGTLAGLPPIYSEPWDNALGTNYGTGAGGPNNLGWFWGLGTFGDVDAEFVTTSNNPFNQPGGGTGLGDWTVTSNDVNTAYGVPEPVTMLGVFMGVGGLAGYLRRRLF